MPGLVSHFEQPTKLVTGYAQALNLAYEALRELAPEAEDRGVAIAVENVWNQFLLSPVEMGEATRAGLDEALPAEEAEEVVEGSGAGTGVLEAGLAAEVAPAVKTRTVVEFAPDTVSTALTGMIAAAAAVMCVAGLTAASIMQGVWPSILDGLYANLWIFGLASVVVTAVAAGIGVFVGKRSQS